VKFTDSITTTCPSSLGGLVSWTANGPLGPNPPLPAQLFNFADPIASPGPPPIPSLLIPKNNPTFCTVDFNFQVLTPPSDSSCTTGAAPLSCCTGSTTGFCETGDNAKCNDIADPFPCCTGLTTGFCGVANANCTGPGTTNIPGFPNAACCIAAGVGFCLTGQGSDATCTTGPAPLSCCTGAGTGFCEAKDNAACTGFLKPFPCCRGPGAGIGTCGDIFQLGRYVVADCDNNVLVSSQTQTAELPMCVTPVTPDFNCYQCETKVSTPVTSLASMFGTFTAAANSLKVDGSQRLCTPAVKVTDPATPVVLPSDPNAHLVAYKVEGSNLKATDGKGVLVHTKQFGDFTVDVKRIALKAALLVPSSKSTVANTPPPFVDQKTGHFLCFNIDTLSGTIPAEVMDRDQFNPQPPGSKVPQGITFTDQNSWRLCAPVDKNGEDPSVDPNAMSADGLLCLVTGPDINSPIKPGVFVSYSNQFQNAQKKAHLDKLDDFCVPATITK
jgi:hypothetical protein